MENESNIPIEAESLMHSVEHEFSIEVGDINIGEELTIKTTSSEYHLERRADGFYMYGGEKFFKKPTKVEVIGCTFGGSILKVDTISEGMQLEVVNLETNERTTTSFIKKITKSPDISLTA